MKKDAKAFAPTAARGTCIALAFAGAFAAAAKPPVSDTVNNPAPIEPSKGIVAPNTRLLGDDGSIAGPVTLWDNGPIDTGEAQACTVPGTRSTLQTATPLCLNTFGFGVAAATIRVADDFTLTQCATISEVEIYAYTTGALTPTVTGAVVTLHSGRPFCPSSSVVATVNASGASLAVSFTNTYRASATDCSRRIQRVRVATPTFPQLPPGTYWLSWAVTGGNFCPPVTILGQQGKPGANSQQSTGNGGAFATIFDTGGVPPACTIPPPGVAQDMPFILKGTTATCGGACPGDINPNGNVDVNDLLAVVTTWGPCPGCPPATCPADVAPLGPPPGNCIIDVNDLLQVITTWGPCPPGGPPVPPQSTGACCTGASCSVTNLGACLAGGGTYFGDGVACSATNGCSPPANDECAGAVPLADGNTNLLTTLATNSADAAPLCGAIGRDVWFSLQTVNGTSYTVSTLGTAAGCANVGDTLVQIVAGCGGAEIACNDDVLPGTLSSSTFVGDGTSVRIRIGTFGTGNGGTMVVNLSHVP